MGGTASNFEYNEALNGVSNHDMPSEQDNQISIQVNGKPLDVPPGLTISGLLEHMRIEPGHVAVELDRTIVHKPLWKETHIHAGAELEIVHFVGGGRWYNL